ncbi:MAG: double-strand break repair protein AddB [Xanthobacteraceae bacterium]|nr:double-strand break repair protein AddB [Xanthobacteraceae bacterium]
MSPLPRVFTIPPTVSFLPALARGILDGRIVPGFNPRGKPELLASATIYLPTRRAARALAEAFLQETKADALLLPRIVPLGDVDEEAFAFEGGDLEPLAPAISVGERRLALAKLISGFAHSADRPLPESPAIAIALADELAHLIDDFITADKDFSEAQNAVEGEFDEYWDRSRAFLGIVDQGWNGFLKEHGKIDAARRRDQLLAREAERLGKSNAGPVIAAGSTGTLPKVAGLMRVIARHPQGAVVLPGLDQLLDGEAFALIGGDAEPMPGHPQFGLRRLLQRIGIERDAVTPLGVADNPAREEILSLAFRPQPKSGESARRIAPGHSLQGVTLIEATDAREEALAIAIALREAMQQEKTAALVTPDRALARRVCAELTRWNIEIDDSAGLPLADSEAGRLAQLAAKAATDDAAPSALLAFLTHPYMRSSFAADDVALLEIACLRGPRPEGGAAGIPAALEAKRRDTFHRSDRRSRFAQEDWDRASGLAARLAQLLAPLSALAKGEHAFAKIAAAHFAALLPVLAENENAGCAEILGAIEALSEAGNAAPEFSLSDYAEAFPSTIRETVLRPARAENTRLRILGPLEARMISADRIVLGGLCEGVWPPEAHTDSWLNRPMRKHLGLDLPERRIGLSAHDFVQAAGNRELFLTRARKQNGVETIASRFVQRLSAVADEGDWDEARKNGERYLRFARGLEAAAPEDAATPPAPKPPLASRPRSFSMSDMRDLARDPYSIYARKILRLQKLEAIDEEPGVADRGTLLHEILSKFTARHPGALPASALDDMLEIGRGEFASMQSHPAAFAIWWPRFERAAKWFVAQEHKRRADISRIHSEVGGKLEIDAGGTRFTLTARADRIEVRVDDKLSVLDFKTGVPPTYKAAILGFEPQLLLEAAIARNGGFENIEGGDLAEVGPIRISGGQPPGEFALFEPANSKDFKSVAEPRGIVGEDHLDRAAEYALAGARRLLAEYTKQETAYPFAPRVQWQKEYNDYEHLARFKEWSEGE